MKPGPPKPSGRMKRPDPLIIRTFRDSDSEAVLDIVRELQVHERQYYDRLKPPEDIGPWYIDKLKVDVDEHKGSLLVAECDGVVCGYVALLTEVSSEDAQDEILYSFSHVGDLAVLKSHRGQGIGGALMAECERLSRAAGQKWLRLSVLAGNDGARRFYDDFGLEEVFLTLEKKLT